MALTSDCTVVKPGPKNSAVEEELCDITATDDATLRFLNLPPTQYTRGFRTDDAFGGASIRMHGTHMAPDVDYAPGGPSNCVSTGPNGDWRDCAAQQNEGMALSMLGPYGPMLGLSPTDQNCTCGYWADGSSPILNVYDGRVIAEENMVTIDQLDMIRTGELTNPYTELFGPEGSAMPGGHLATHTYSELVGSKWRFGLMIQAEHVRGYTPGSDMTKH